MIKKVFGIFLAVLSAIPILLLCGLFFNLSLDYISYGILYILAVLLALESQRFEFKKYRSIFGPLTYTPISLLGALALFPPITIPFYINTRFKVARGISKLNEGKIDYLPTWWQITFTLLSTGLIFSTFFPGDYKFIPESIFLMGFLIVIPLGVMYRIIDEYGTPVVIEQEISCEEKEGEVFPSEDRPDGESD